MVENKEMLAGVVGHLKRQSTKLGSVSSYQNINNNTFD